MSVLDDPAGLEAVADGLRAGHSLPADWYADPALLVREHQLIFRRSWQYAGRAEQVEAPGSYLTTDAGPVPLAVVRDRAGELRALVNVCRHRGHPVVDGAGRCSTLQCPYHAWTYDLDGALRKVPRGEREPGLDPGELGLLPASVATWGPFLFVHPDPDAPPLADALGELPAVLADCGVALDRLAFRVRVPWTLEANWKIAIENYLECYHCPVAHPGLAQAIDVGPDGYALEEFPAFSVQRGASRAGSPGWMHGGEIHRAQYHWLWPNVTINIDPGPQNLSLDVWRPDGPGRTLGFTDYFFSPDVPAATAEEIVAFSLQTGREDVALVEAVQRGMASGAVATGRLMPESERLVAHFQRLVVDALRG
jgi:phenylpropionate dioxygenase-like ring-hydroxylating dioxygenase large terminal subunit